VGARRIAVGVFAALMLSLVLSTPAQAEVANHPFINAVISGLEPEPKPLRPKLEKPCGVTVTPEGTIYVSDYARQAIIGTSLTELFPDNGPCGLAYDGNNLYVNEWHGSVVNPDAGTIDAGRATGVAVHPITKDLYVSHRTSVAVYTAPVEPGDTPAHVIGEGSLGDAYGVAVSAFPATDGNVYVADAEDDTVKVYDPSVSMSQPAQVIEGANTAAGRFVSLTDSSLAVDSGNGTFFVVDNTTPLAEHPSAAVFEFNTAGVFRGRLEHSIVHGAPVGIAVDESGTPANGQVYVTSGNGSSIVIPPELGPPVTEQGALYAFGPAGPGQTIEVSTSGPGDGTVSSEPVGINCPAGCEAELNSGASVTLTANPAPGSAFAGWSGGGCSGTGLCQVILNSATTVDAEFLPAPSLTAVAGQTASAVGANVGGGSDMTSPASGTLRIGKVSAAGDSVTLKATIPAPGTITATGEHLRRARAHFAHAGAVTLRLHLDKAGRRALARSRTGRLRVPLTVSFSPSPPSAGIVLRRTASFAQPK
jgi:hypothetical protein